MTLLRSLFIALIVSIAIFGGASVAYSQTCDSNKFCPLTDVKGSRLETVFDQAGNTSLTLSDFFSGLFTTALSVGAILAVLRLGWAGYLYMTSDSFGSKGKAKEVIGDVVLGLFLLLSCWLILNQINPDILRLDILKTLGLVQTAPANGAGTPAPATTPAPTSFGGSSSASGSGAGNVIGGNAGSGIPVPTPPPTPFADQPPGTSIQWNANRTTCVYIDPGTMLEFQAPGGVPLRCP